jgi:hypothetical protein
MSYAICLDQNTPNFNVNTLSANGFSIYTNLDLQNPIYQGIPYTQLFQPPIGNCPFLVTVPQGATQLIIIDQCDPNLDVAAAIFSPTNLSAGQLTVECCYAVIDIPQGPPPTFCETCTLTFDTFLTATTGSIIAGNLSSTCGPVTGYTIGWYLNGNYSSPGLVSGYGVQANGTPFPTPFQHPLTGNSAVPVLAGNWEGIIHDIIINGVTYSSVSGSAGGQSIPFESCFDTVVAEPLNCENGAYQGIAKYSHQINFNSQAVGAIPAPVSLTYALDSTTKYFAYFFNAYNVWDEIEIKWKSGNPNATPNPSFYSQPIYLEKLKRGADIPPIPNPYFPPGIQLTNPQIPVSENFVFNDVWPKVSTTFYTNTSIWGGFQRVLTLTTLPTSSNPLFPDLLEITITPNPTNNNTQWKAAFQCLDNFDCTDCNYTDWKNNLPKISSLYLEKQYGCDAQRIVMTISGCIANSDLFNDFNNPTTTLYGNLVGSYHGTGTFITQNFPSWPPYLALTGTTTCGESIGHFPVCGNSSTGSITLNKTPGQIQLTFTDYNDYLHYKNYLLFEYNNISPSPGLSPLSCPAGGTNLSYYQYFSLAVPIQLTSTANCGDNSTINYQYFHINDYFNIQYVNDNNPNATSWEMIIPQTPMVNCYPFLPCNNCNGIINNFVNTYNGYVQNATSFTFTTTVGAKYTNPFSWVNYIYSTGGGGSASGSYCFSNFKESYFPWYSTHTIPFISSPSSPTGWLNLTNLSSSLPCNFNEYPGRQAYTDSGWIYKGAKIGYQVRFPNLTGSFNYSLSTNDFEIYALTNLTNTGSLDANLFQSPPLCPDPSGSLIYSYIGGVPTVYSASYFVGGSPTLVIDP